MDIGFFVTNGGWDYWVKHSNYPIYSLSFQKIIGKVSLSWHEGIVAFYRYVTDKCVLFFSPLTIETWEWNKNQKFFFKSEIKFWGAFFYGRFWVTEKQKQNKQSRWGGLPDGDGMRTLSRTVKCAPGEVENEDGGWCYGPGTALYEDPTGGTRWGASTRCRTEDTQGGAAHRWVSIKIVHWILKMFEFITG